MRSVDLSIVPGWSTVQETLSLMREEKRSAIVVDDGKAYRLVAAADVVIACVERGMETRVGDLDGTTLPMRRPRQEAPWLVSLRYDGITSDSILEDVTMTRISVHAADHVIAALESSPRDCYCSVDKSPVAGGNTGGTCPDGHSGSVRCV